MRQGAWRHSTESAARASSGQEFMDELHLPADLEHIPEPHKEDIHDVSWLTPQPASVRYTKYTVDYSVPTKIYD